jgi:hypothetical protein
LGGWGCARQCTQAARRVGVRSGRVCRAQVECARSVGAFFPERPLASAAAGMCALL